MTQLPRKLSDWPESWRFLYEERAGLMEFCGGLSRAEAERQAEQDIRHSAEILEPEAVQPVLWKEMGK